MRKLWFHHSIYLKLKDEIPAAWHAFEGIGDKATVQANNSFTLNDAYKTV